MVLTLQLQIGTHRFKVRVEEENKARMLAAARRVEDMLESCRTIEKVADGERAAVMVALRLASTENTIDESVLDEIEVVLDEALRAGQGR